MSTPRRGAAGTGPGLGTFFYLTALGGLALYFAFAAVQGEYGLLRRVQVEAETRALMAERAELIAARDALANKTQRLSEEFLDLDLLDTQARDVLGLIRSDEIVIR